MCKWSKEDSKIARFMHNVDPRKKYTKQEITNCLKQYNKALDNVIKKETDKDYGMIFRENSNGTYQIYPELVSGFEKYF